MDYAALRKQMVQEQLVLRDIKEQKILDVFGKIERHRFLPEELAVSAYADFPLPIGEGQTISQPYIVALMTQALELSGKEKVLEVGTGSGYQAAILAELAGEVYTIERFETLFKKAEALFQELGYKNIHPKVADGSLGWQEDAPFDRIIVTAATNRIPLPLQEQLKDGGKMVVPLGSSFSQVLTLVEKKGGLLEHKNICACVFVPLIGKFAGKE